ncbi:MAG TPA: protein kinase, partial [Polyangiaceae bacterium]|nr:protein kinase [Polyangiaceae bacterium]
LGPTVLFDHFDGIPLDAFIRTHPELPFAERAALIEIIGNTLAHCHRKKVLHGGLCPNAVLVKRQDDGRFDVRLFNFQLGAGEGISGTVHWSALSDEPWSAYRAPELRDTQNARSKVSDVFSLGALAYFILTGQDPATGGIELDQRLEKEGALDPRVVDDAIHPEVAEVIRLATELSPIARADDVADWLNNFFLEAVTAPEGSAEADIDPLMAKKGDVIDGTLTVERVLGQGASARALEVTSSKHDGNLALKVALSDVEGDRLEEEGKLLARFHHSHIVQFFEQRRIAGRVCLLMALAGNASLGQRLRKEGPLSLDFASRFGEDLLDALEELENARVLHRDIKPENLGVGALSRKAQHLVLFDFSLAVDVRDPDKCAAKLKELGAGTGGYRDPFLRQRGAWDHAADRWAAAVTLHEMLTGVLPSWLPDGVAPWVDGAQLNLAAERFDPSVREQLTKFFEQALRPAAETRFESAEVMRRAWNRAFEAPKRKGGSEPLVENATAEDATEQLPWEGRDLRQIAPESSIQLLPLDSRALNALDRAGLTRVSDLLTLPDNRLSAVRGVGTLVAKRILEFRDAWNAATNAPVAQAEPFFSGFRGEEARLAQTDLAVSAVRAFEDAGLPTLGAVASAPRAQVEALARRAALDPQALQALLQSSSTPPKQEHPASLDEWLRALLPSQAARRKNLETLFGLTGALTGQLDATQAEAARSLDQTPANLSIALGQAADTWRKHPYFAELSLLVHELLALDAPARFGADAARALGQRLGETSLDALGLCKSAALIRMVCAAERAEPTAPRWVRIHERAWLVADEALTTELRELGQAADKLAARSVIAAAGETARTLRTLVEGSRLSRSSDEALAQLATAASRSAACSSRLEIYPRGMEVKRALDLTSSVLGGELESERLRQLVAQRYPEAEPLPERPELDALVKAYGLEWNAEYKKYLRPGATL